MSPDVSILIVTYKCRDEAQECLASIYGQAHGVRFETLVLDNASADGTVDMVRLDEAIAQLALTHTFKAKPKAEDVFDGAFLPPLAERKVQ